MSLLIVMSAAGTIPLLFYYLIHLCAPNRYRDQSKVFLLKLSIFFFLCPFQQLKYVLPANIEKYLWFLFPQKNGSEKMYLKRKGYILTGYLSGDFRLIPKWQLLLILIWILIIVFFLGYQISKYRKLKRFLRQSSRYLDDEKIIDLISNIPQMENLYRKRKVKCMQNSMFASPFTVGFLKPLIVFPEGEFDRNSREMILHHELIHIKNKDILVKYICFFIILLHWFNPASWLLLYEYGVESEYICDIAVTAYNKSWNDKKTYARLITEMASQDTKIPIMFSDFLSKGEKRLKARIQIILNSDKKKKRLAPLLILSILGLCSFTSIGYKKKPFANREDYKSLEDYSEVYILLNYDAEFLKEQMKFSNSDYVFVDEEGKIFDIPYENDLIQKEACSHKYIPGRIEDHEKQKAGGCSIIIYSASVCEKCGHLKDKKEISRAEYNPCIH